MQTAVSNPTASGTATAFVSGISQNAQGVISPTRASVPTASTSVAGLVQLNNTLTSSSTSQALTAAQGKALNDKMVKHVAINGATISYNADGTFQFSDSKISTITAYGALIIVSGTNTGNPFVISSVSGSSIFGARLGTTAAGSATVRVIVFGT